MHTSQMVKILSMFKHWNSGHIVNWVRGRSLLPLNEQEISGRTLTSTSPRPKSNPPGKRQTTSMLSPPIPASSLIISPARGAGYSRILDICLHDMQMTELINLTRITRQGKNHRHSMGLNVLAEACPTQRQVIAHEVVDWMSGNKS